MRNLKTHNHVRPGRLLALALAVAMIMSVVPAFGITAGAAAPASGSFDEAALEKIYASATKVFDGSYNKSQTDIFNKDLRNKQTVSGASEWVGWTETDNTNSAVYLTTVYDNNNTYNRLEYRRNQNSGGGTNVKTSDAVRNATSNKDYIVIEFLKYAIPGTPSYVMTFYSKASSDGNAPSGGVEFLKFDYKADGIYPSTLTTQNSDNDANGKRAYTTDPIATANYTPVRVYIAKNSNATYDIIWQTAENGVYTNKCTVQGLPADRISGGIGTMRGYLNSGNGVAGFADLKIYAGNYADEITVNYVLKDGTNIGSTSAYVSDGALVINDRVAPSYMVKGGTYYVRNDAEGTTAAVSGGSVDVRYNKAEQVSSADDTKNATWVAIEYDLGTLTDYKDLAMKDAVGNLISGLCDAWKANDGFFILDGERSYGELSSNRVTKVATTEGNGNRYAVLYYNDYNGNAKIRTIIEPHGNTYDVTYVDITNGKNDVIVTITYNGTINGLAFPEDWDYTKQGTGVSANNAASAFGDYKIYAYVPRESDVNTLKAALDTLTVPATLTRENLDLVQQVTDSVTNTFDVTWESNPSGIINSDGTLNLPEEPTEVTLTPTAMLNDETKVSGASSVVTVFPKAYAVGDTYVDGSRTYTVDEVILDGNTDGVQWLGRQDKVTSERPINYTKEYIEGKGVSATKISLGNTGNGPNGSIKIDPGYTYLVRFYYGKDSAFTAAHGDLYNKVFTTHFNKFDDYVDARDNKGWTKPDVQLTDNDSAENAFEFIFGSKDSGPKIDAGSWTKVEKVFNASEYSEYITFVYAWTATASINDLEVVKISIDAQPAKVTVNFHSDGVDGVTVPQNKTIENDIYVGEPYTYQFAAGEYFLDAGNHKQTFYVVDKAKSTNLTISELAETNTIDIYYKKVEFAAVQNMPATGTVYFDQFTNEAVTVKDGAQNIVTNPSFETTDGEFNLLGWYSVGQNSNYDGSAPAPAWDWVFKVNAEKYWAANQDDKTNEGKAHDYGVQPGGNWALGTRWNDTFIGDGNSDTSIYANFPAEPNTKYYVSFWVKANTDDDAYMNIFTVDSVEAAPQKPDTSDFTICIANEANDHNTGRYQKVNAADWTKVEKVITTGEADTAIQIQAYYLGVTNNNGNGPNPFFVFDDFVIVAADEAKAVIESVTNPTDTFNVISGNKPWLPAALTAKLEGNPRDVKVSVTWDYESADLTNTGSEPVTKTVNGTVAGYDGEIKANVMVYPMTFDMPDTATVGEPGNVRMFPIELKEEFKLEFDLTVNKIGDTHFALGAGGSNAYFGDGQIGLSPNGNVLKATGGDGSGWNKSENKELVAAEAGKTYRVFLTANASTQKFTLDVTTQEGNVYSSGELGFRKAGEYVDTLTMVTKGTAGDMEISNVKFYAPEAVKSLIEYSINYENVPEATVSASGAKTSVQTTMTTDLGYDGTKVFPNLEIPYFQGYIFRTKTVDTTAKTITLTYEVTNPGNWFDNVADDTTIVSLNMLGAHDAFTSGIGESLKGDAANATMENNILSGAAANAFRTKAVSGSQTQDADAYALLEAGVRYFDIRLSRSAANYTDNTPLIGVDIPHTNGVFYTTHSLLGDEFRPIAYTIGQWAKEHPGEIIFLDFQAIADTTSRGSTGGNYTANSCADVSAILEEAGILSYVRFNNSTQGNGALAYCTYKDFTKDRTEPGFLVFGQSLSGGVGQFIVRKNQNEFDGRVFSYYNSDNHGTSFKESQVEKQIEVENTRNADHPINWMIRVMQAQSQNTLGGLIGTANSDHNSLLAALKNHSEWLSYLPIIMVDDADTNTSGILELLKECNVAQDVTVNYVDEDGSSIGSSVEKLMIGTIYNPLVGSLVNGDEYIYIDTNIGNNAVKQTVVPVPYNVSIDNVKVKSTDSVWTWRGPYTDEEDANKVKHTFPYGHAFSSKLTDVDPYDGLYTGFNDFGALNWGATGFDRVGIAVLDVSDLGTEYATDYYLEANRVRHSTNGTMSVKFYAITYDKYKELDLTQANPWTDVFTDENYIYGFTSTNDIKQTDQEMIKYKLDSSVIENVLSNISGNKVVILANTNVGLFALEGATMKITSEVDLITIEDSVLGAKDNNDLGIEFTVDFSKALSFEELQFTVTVEFLEGSDWKQVEDAKVVTEDAKSNEGKVKILVVPGNSNLPYSIVAKATKAGEAVVTKEGPATSLYEEVIKNIATKGYTADELNAKRLANANDVIAKGGLLDIGDDELDDVRKSIMAKNGNTVSIQSKFVEIGIGFRYANGRIFVGSSENLVAKTEDGEAVEDIVYTSITKKDDGTYVLGNPINAPEGASLAEVVIYLEDVEFLFESVDEIAADENISGELEFIEEV